MNLRILALVLSGLLFTGSSSAHATAVTQDQAESFLKQCLANSAGQFLSEESQQSFCNCTAAQMLQSMRVEDIQAMAAQDPAIARPAYNRMITEVYAPCMEEPTRAYHYKTCISDNKVGALGDPEKICRCAADSLASYMRDNGRAVYSAILARAPDTIDPNGALFSDPGFQKIASQKTMGCLKK